MPSSSIPVAFAFRSTLECTSPVRPNWAGQKCGHRVLKALCNKEEKGKRPKISFGDQLLDYIEGGPKLRKWYGAPDQLPRDGKEITKQIGSSSDESQPEEKVATLVTDADSETGELVVLSLILRRLPVKVLVKDVKAAVASFGPYVEPFAGDVSDAASVRNAMKGVKSVIIPSKAGIVPEVAKEREVEHVVLLSESDEGGALSSLFNWDKSARKQSEGLVKSCGVPYTIARTGKLLDEPGGSLLVFSQEQNASNDQSASSNPPKSVPAAVSRADAAEVCVRALQFPPARGTEFQVVVGSEGASNGGDVEWSELFLSLAED